MMTPRFPLLTSCAVALTLLCASAIVPAPAQADTAQDQVIQAQILPGWDDSRGGSRMAAIQLDLAPGWKTYWRSPGNAGIPPQFDWSRSENLKSVKFHWPRPSIFLTNGLQTLGYRRSLILPIELEPLDPKAPIVLNAAIDLGICLDVCLPASFTLHHDLTPNTTPDPAIRAALAQAPQSPRQAKLARIRCAFTPIRDGMQVTAQLDLPAVGRHEVVRIENDDPNIWVSEAEVSREGQVLHARAELVAPSGQPFAVDRGALTVTVISENTAVEIHGCPG